jgi:phage terminase large subunit-like protein
MVTTLAPRDESARKLTFYDLRKFLTLEEIADMISKLDANEAYKLKYDYEFWARPTQRLPKGRWRCWFLKGGRGSGKTWTGSNVIKKWSKTNKRTLMVGRTAYDVRDTMVEGESGIMAVCPKQWRPEYSPSKRKLTWPNGAVTLLRSADEPDSFRGIQFHKAWGDEVAAWRYGKETWDQIMFGLRLGDDPQIVVTSTPRPTKLVKDIVGLPTTITTTDSTYANVENLAEGWASDIINRYRGTRTGLQELEGRILDDNPYALWTRAQLDATRVFQAPDIVEVVVAVDPMVKDLDSPAKIARIEGGAEQSEEDRETGIVVVGRTSYKGDVTAHGYTLDDMSMTGTPLEWCTQVVTAYYKYQADKVVAEANNGGALVKAAIHAIDPNVPVELVYAARGKVTRAEPVSNIFAQGRGHNMGTFAELEDQLCEWQPGMPSPDRLDALVWGYTYLMGDPESVTIRATHGD